MHVQAFEQHPHAKQAQVLRACIRVHAWARPCARAWRAHGPVSTDQTQAPRWHAHTQQQHLPARQTQTTVRRCAWNTRIRVAVVHEERRLVRPRPNGQCRQPQTEQYGRRRCPAAVPSRTTHAITVATTGRVLSPCRRPPALLVSAHPVLAARLSSSSHFPTLRDEVETSILSLKKKRTRKQASRYSSDESLSGDGDVHSSGIQGVGVGKVRQSAQPVKAATIVS